MRKLAHAGHADGIRIGAGASAVLRDGLEDASPRRQRRGVVEHAGGRGVGGEQIDIVAEDPDVGVWLRFDLQCDVRAFHAHPVPRLGDLRWSRQAEDHRNGSRNFRPRAGNVIDPRHHRVGAIGDRRDIPRRCESIARVAVGAD